MRVQKNTLCFFVCSILYYFLFYLSHVAFFIKYLCSRSATAGLLKITLFPYSLVGGLAEKRANVVGGGFAIPVYSFIFERGLREIRSKDMGVVAYTSEYGASIECEIMYRFCIQYFPLTAYFKTVLIEQEE